jgi:large subunit ribosomal protein L33
MCPYLVLICGLDGMQGLLAVTNGAAENDEAIVDEPVHECRVPGPAVLVPDLTRGVPAWGPGGLFMTSRNYFHEQVVAPIMSRSTIRPVIKLRSTAGTGYTYVTRKSRRNDPDRLVIRKYDPVIGRHVEFREER